LVIWKAGNRYRTGDTVRESAGLVMRCDDFPEIPAIGLNISKIEPVFPARQGKDRPSWSEMRETTVIHTTGECEVLT